MCAKGNIVNTKMGGLGKVGWCQQRSESSKVMGSASLYGRKILTWNLGTQGRGLLQFRPTS